MASTFGAALMITAGLTAAMAQTESASTTVPAMLPTSITAGYIDPDAKVPTLNGVPGAGVENLDISFPQALLVHGNQYVYSITVQDNNYTGSCTVSYSLTQVQNGKTVVLDSAKITTFKTAPGDYWLWVDTGKIIPDSPGLATLTGTFKCGTNTNSIRSTMLIQ